MDSGLVRRIRNGLKVLSNGAQNFRAKVDLEVTAVSKQAKEAIEVRGFGFVRVPGMVGAEKDCFFRKLGVG